MRAINAEPSRAFTLVEVLIVVVILGILAAVVVPAFASATRDASEGATYSELQKVRRAIDVYFARNENAPPPIETGDRTWGPIAQGDGEYLKNPARNSYLPGAAQWTILADAIAAPDESYQTDNGWIYNTTTGELWAGSFDEMDRPIPQP
jgi:general secretion pathway protein G